MLITTYLIYLGYTLLCLSKDKHYKEVFNKKINKKFKIFVNLLSSIILIASLIVLIKNIGFSLGITYWIGISALIIFFIALILTYTVKQFLYISISLFPLCSLVYFL